MDKKRSSLVVASFPRSGTHLMIDTLRANFKSLNVPKLPLQRTHRTFVTADHVAPGSPANLPLSDLVKRLSGPHGVLVKTHSHPACWAPEQPLAKAMKRSRRRPLFIYVLRNPVKVMRSAWSYACRFDANAPRNFRVFFKDYPASSLLPWDRRTGSVLEGWARHVREWVKSDDVLVLNSEKLLHNPRPVLTRIAQSFDLPFSAQAPVEIPPLARGFWQRSVRRLLPRPKSTAVLGDSPPIIPDHTVKELWQMVFELVPEDYIPLLSVDG